jgi:ribosome recycling factor
MDSLLREAEEDLQKLKADSGDALDASSASEVLTDSVAADLDEMMKKADKELAELMKG